MQQVIKTMMGVVGVPLRSHIKPAQPVQFTPDTLTASWSCTTFGLDRRCTSKDGVDLGMIYAVCTHAEQKQKHFNLDLWLTLGCCFESLCFPPSRGRTE